MLPKVDVPIFELDLPLSKKKVKFRPFLVKEEKILLMAMESDDDNGVLLSIKQILNNCCLSEDIDIEKLPIVDLEFFFLNLRARSVSEVVELQYKCNNKVKDEDGNEKDCNHIVPIEVNVLDIQPKLPEGHTNKVELSDKLGIIMKYPTIASIENVKEDSSEVELLMNILHDSIESVYDDENIYHTKDVSKEELNEFIEGLTKEQFSKVQKFFDSIPKIKKDIEFKCSKCNYEEKVSVEGIQNFFV